MGFVWVGNGRRYNIELCLTWEGVSLRFQVTGYVQLVGGELTPGGGGFPYEKGGDACRKF